MQANFARKATMNKSGLTKIADLFTAKDKHDREYLVSKYDGAAVYYIFKNDYQNTNNAEYILYRKGLDVKRRKKRRPKRH